jgi:hypothetical protein
MKPRGAKFEYEQERNNDLMQAYHQLVEEADFICLPAIYKEVVNKPASRFYVSEERAAIVVGAMMRGVSIDNMVPNKREMFQEIFQRAMVIRKEHPDMPILEVVFQVVRQPAPKFYLTPGSAKAIIFRAKQQWYETRKKRLRHLF